MGMEGRRIKLTTGRATLEVTPHGVGARAHSAMDSQPRDLLSFRDVTIGLYPEVRERHRRHT